MIKFYGEYSEKTKKYLLKKNIAVILGCFIGAGGLGVLPLVIYIAIVVDFLIIIPSYFIILFLSGIIFVVDLNIRKEKVIEIDGLKLIEINDKENYLRMVDYENNITTHKFTRIIKVIETEEWYILKLRFRIVGILCQKDWLKEGTVEEFEEMFAGKIVRKERDERAS